MVAHPSEYPWSSYLHNALGQANELVTPHLEYRRLGKTAVERQAAYCQPFKHRIPYAEIREATNKAWVLGNEDELVTPHRLYNRLGATPEKRATVYRQLFKVRIAEKNSGRNT